MKKVFQLLLLCGCIAGGVGLSNAGYGFQTQLRWVVCIGAIVCWIISWKECGWPAGFLVFVCGCFVGNALPR